MLADVAPFAEATSWQPALDAYARSLRAALLRHSGVLPLLATRPAATPETLRMVERGLGVMRAAGFPLGRALDAINSLTLFVLAHAASEVRTAPVNEAEGAGSTAFLAALAPEEFPLLAEAAGSGQGTDDEERFAFALDALLTGFAAWLRSDQG
ncbi:TetR/AcrR family transcriptional regulator C-terminal domain-containing protein [Kitasatospora sp. NBC_01266]|uniref:TetR/AcrR family transcriptional regulator C-terminal domain-containing protein n=1 Tax=Kitasatospora sp. NBC_01266 TaxID=2903572 RepID=UPI002E34585A|nr:TetR/AcrR family transcriptional regulator C-terminal domain-containing protein [Kitasatospora sp. NBC_01266]